MGRHLGRPQLCCGLIAGEEHRGGLFCCIYLQILALHSPPPQTWSTHTVVNKHKLYCASVCPHGIQLFSNPLSQSSHHRNSFYRGCLQRWLAWVGCLDSPAGITVFVIALHHQRPQLILNICMFSVVLSASSGPQGWCVIKVGGWETRHETHIMVVTRKWQ